MMDDIPEITMPPKNIWCAVGGHWTTVIINGQCQECFYNAKKDDQEDEQYGTS